MSLDFRPQSPQKGIGAKPARTPSPIKTPPKDASIFGGKQYIPMGEAGRRLEKVPLYIPGSPGQITKKEIGELTEGLKKKYGTYLKQQDRSQALRDLETQKSKAPTIAEKIKIERQARFLKKGLFGK